MYDYVSFLSTLSKEQLETVIMIVMIYGLGASFIFTMFCKFFDWLIDFICNRFKKWIDFCKEDKENDR